MVNWWSEMERKFRLTDICFPIYDCWNCPNWKVCFYLRTKWFGEVGRMGHLMDVVKGIREDLEKEGLKGLLEPYGEPFEVRATISSMGHICEGQLLIAFGGPNVWVISDGKTVRVEGYWGSDSYTETLEDEKVAKEILEYVKDVFKDVVIDP